MLRLPENLDQKRLEWMKRDLMEETDQLHNPHASVVKVTTKQQREKK
jgi:hypothetical protein